MNPAFSTFICLGLHALLVCFGIEASMEEDTDFWPHVENHTRLRDDTSRKYVRLYQLYSRTSGKHLQVLGRRISAKGEDGNKYDLCDKVDN
ncbi:fibroblast growth factor 18-like [Hemitrygon akajei]|uniref:fibroblast growth factor 18-like n=1 Tax=Hemitrygon akajei TaxID=2704970 RepID=UPI003BF9EE50